uniref:hypothetical protein n=1 Tax=Polynucleobacter sp. TaxID=2029855 RepID=UPI004047576B
MKKIITISLLSALILSGCAGNLILVDKNNQQSVGQFNSLSKSLDVNMNGKKYSGFYITNASVGIINTQVYGVGTSTSGTSQSFYGGNSGRAVLRSIDGDTIQCEFNYEGMKAIGTCIDSKGDRYQLIAG